MQYKYGNDYTANIIYSEHEYGYYNAVFAIPLQNGFINLIHIN